MRLSTFPPPALRAIGSDRLEIALDFLLSAIS